MTAQYVWRIISLLIGDGIMNVLKKDIYNFNGGKISRHDTDLNHDEFVNEGNKLLSVLGLQGTNYEKNHGNGRTIMLKDGRYISSRAMLKEVNTLAQQLLSRHRNSKLTDFLLKPNTQFILI